MSRRINSYNDLKVEKEVRHSSYYERIEKINNGVILPKPELRECKYKNIRQLNHALVIPKFTVK